MRHEEFATQIRQALENLHDFARLQSLPLIAELSRHGQTTEQAVRQIRSELIEAVERLKPPGNLPPRAKERRPYAIVYGRYIQGLGTTELIEELAISVRQLRREQKRALKTVVDLMWDQFASALSAAMPPIEQAVPSADRHEVASAEVEQLISGVQHENLALLPLVRSVWGLLNSVSIQHRTLCQDRLPDHLPSVRANRVVLRQGLLGVLSYAIHRAGEGEILLEGAGDSQGVVLSVRATGKVLDAPRAGVSLEISHKLIASSGGTLDLIDSLDKWTARISLPVAEASPILVIDDNAGLISLFRRYLAGHHYSVSEAHSAQEAIQQAQQVDLKLIILDIMMPDQDGWEILQSLRNAPATAQTPIMICSVMNEPELAFSLGASDYVTKPVSQAGLLAKVEYWCSVPPVLGEPPTGSPASSADSPSS
ncbi:MAG: response regulator [Caldilineaceae bacterium]|nr:response regulator [Caldilineaceae bacterium]